MNSKKILIITNSYPPDHSGAGVDIKRNYQLLLENKFPLSVTILTKTRDDGYLNKDIAGLTVIRKLKDVSFKTPIDIISNLFNIIRHILSNEIIHYNAADILQLMSVPFAIFTNKKIFLQLHCMGDDDPDTVGKGKYGLFLFYLYKKVPFFKTYSNAQTASLINNGVDEKYIFEIPPFIDSDTFFSVSKTEKLKLRQLYGFDESAIIITSIGRIGFRKGTDIILDAYEILKEKYSNLELLLVGPVDRMPREISMKLSLLEKNKNYKVRLVGERYDISGLLQNSDYFLLPSRNEGFGIVLIEAMACGIPVITSNLEGIFDSIIKHNYNGLIVDGYDALKYAEAIESLVINQEKKKFIIKNALENIKINYSPQVVTNFFKKLFKQLEQ